MNASDKYPDWAMCCYLSIPVPLFLFCFVQQVPFIVYLKPDLLVGHILHSSSHMDEVGFVLLYGFPIWVYRHCHCIYRMSLHPCLSFARFPKVCVAAARHTKACPKSTNYILTTAMGRCLFSFWDMQDAGAKNFAPMVVSFGSTQYLFFSNAPDSFRCGFAFGGCRFWTCYGEAFYKAIIRNFVVHIESLDLKGYSSLRSLVSCSHKIYTHTNVGYWVLWISFI